MKKTILVSLFFVSLQFQAQDHFVWQKIAKEQVSSLKRVQPKSASANELYFNLDVVAMKTALLNVKDKFSGIAGVVITIPNTTGVIEQFQVWENSNMEPALQAQFPEIRAFVGKGITDKSATINFSLSPLGFQTMVIRPSGEMEFIESYDKDATSYVLFNSKNRTLGKLPFVCSTEDKNTIKGIANNAVITNRSNNHSYKTMRLALSCTGEYGVAFGGTKPGALAAMNATMTRVNGVYEIDLALHLNIIANDTAVIYTNATTDPYSAAASMANWNAQLQATLTSVLTESVYDIGHLFGASGGGGDAGCIGCVCVNGQKGSGITSPGSGLPSGDSFDIDYVAHEMGHQLGANHSFTDTFEGTVAQVEPGSGSTIMGYAGITSYDVQTHSDAIFCYKNIVQIQSNLATKTCPVSTVMTNATPVVSAGPDFTIPKGTPFMLSGTATDADATDVLTYLWEENDLGTSATANATSRVLATKAIGPIFRTFAPSTSLTRTLPEMTRVLANTIAITTSANTYWETVFSGTANRALNFTFTARDNHPGGGQTNTDATLVTVDVAKGPFTVSSQATAGITYSPGSTQTITWNVANTSTLSGAATVTILLSTNVNGNSTTFPVVLASDVPNNGTATVTIPSNVSSTTCRIMVKPTGNIFFAINSKTFAITCTTPVPPAFTAVAAVCLGATIAPLPSTSNNGVTGTWSPAVNSSITTNYTFTPASGQCAATKTMGITVNPNVTPTFAVVAAICSGTTIAPLSSISNNGISGTWLPAVNNTATTTYTFTPATGQCAATISNTINVNQVPALDLIPDGNYCNFYDLPAVTNGSYFAASGGILPLAVGTRITTSQVIYVYVASSTNPSCSNQSSFMVTVTQNPPNPSGASTQSFTFGETLANLVVNGSQLIWFSSQTDASEQTNPLPTSTPLVDGSTYYVVSSNGNCLSNPLAVTTMAALANSEFTPNRSFVCYPNPAETVLYLENPSAIYNVSLTNVLGQIVLSKDINSLSYPLDVSKLANATYFLQVTSKEGTSYVKLIKK